MNTFNVETVNAMTLNGKNGNPAGVVFDASPLSANDRQRIATQAGHSETAFLERYSSGKYALEFFTPLQRIAFCGHATVATFALLRMKGMENRPVVEVEISGVTLKIFYEEDRVFMEQKQPQYEMLDDKRAQEALEAVRLDMSQTDNRFMPTIVDTGNRFVLLAVRDRQDLVNLRANQTKVFEFSQRNDLIGFYVFLRTAGEHAATSRMFAPRYGITEEAATGMAAGPLAAVLVDHFGVAGPEIRMLQGEFMSPSQPSEIIAYVEMEHSRVSRLKVGGRASITSG